MKLSRCLALTCCVVAAPPLLASESAESGIVAISCPEEECFVAPIFVGEGGFVARRADSDEDVTFVLECGDRFVEATAEPDSMGIVRQVLTADNGMACMADAGGVLEIGNIEAGGWYWINDDRSSAVFALVAKDVLENPKTTPLDPGGVTMIADEADVATWIKHEDSGRIGILGHIQPTERRPGCVSGGKKPVWEHCRIGRSDSWRLFALVGNEGANGRLDYDSASGLGDGGIVRLRPGGAANRTSMQVFLFATNYLAGIGAFVAPIEYDEEGNYRPDVIKPATITGDPRLVNNPVLDGVSFVGVNPLTQAVDLSVDGSFGMFGSDSLVLPASFAPVGSAAVARAVHFWEIAIPGVDTSDTTHWCANPLGESLVWKHRLSVTGYLENAFPLLDQGGGPSMEFALACPTAEGATAAASAGSSLEGVELVPAGPFSLSLQFVDRP